MWGMVPRADERLVLIGTGRILIPIRQPAASGISATRSAGPVRRTLCDGPCATGPVRRALCDGPCATGPVRRAQRDGHCATLIISVPALLGLAITEGFPSG